MKKPEHQWETARATAYRLPPDAILAVEGGHAWIEDARAEAFELRDGERVVGQVVFGLHRQHTDAACADDPGLIVAARAWLAARGGRRLDLRDDSGRVVSDGPFDLRDLSDTPRGSAQRIITLAPSNAEIVHALGCFVRVVACEDSSDHPPQVEHCERLGPDLGPDLDRVAELAPDVVVSSLSVPGMERIVTGLHARRIPQLVLAPRSLDDVLREIEFVAEALAVPSAGRAVVDDLKRQRDELEADRPQQPVRVYLEWWPRPMFSPGAECYSNELIALAGGVNVFQDRPGSSLEVDAFDLRQADPQVCFVSWCGVAAHKLDPQNLMGRKGLGELTAVQQRRVYAVDERFTGRPGPRMLEAARLMKAAIERAGL